MHDSAFTFGGLYVCRPSDTTFAFERLNRDRCNDLLAEMLAADGASWWDSWRINTGVRMGSRWCWNEDSQRKARAAAGIVI
jgi:hypothetical protein